MCGYGYGWGMGLMFLVPLILIVLIVLIGAIVWAAVKLAQPPDGQASGLPSRETPQEILDRRFALGEIDADTYRQSRQHLSSREAGSS